MTVNIQIFTENNRIGGEFMDSNLINQLYNWQL